MGCDAVQNATLIKDTWTFT